MWSNSSKVPIWVERCRVNTETLASAQIELKASPRNPNVATENKSSNVDSFDVACFVAANEAQGLKSHSNRHDHIHNSLNCT